MTLPAPTYDLVLLLDPQSEDAVRAKIVTDARAAIEAGGELLRHDDWGERALTYPIEKKANAQYHLLQFHTGGSELLEGLDRTLRITDGVMRFRIIKLKPGVPDAPDMAASPAPPVAQAAETALAPPAEAEAPVETAAEAPLAPAAETPVEASADATPAASAEEPPAEAVAEPAEAVAEPAPAEPAE